MVFEFENRNYRDIYRFFVAVKQFLQNYLKDWYVRMVMKFMIYMYLFII